MAKLDVMPHGLLSTLTRQLDDTEVLDSLSPMGIVNTLFGLSVLGFSRIDGRVLDKVISACDDRVLGAPPASSHDHESAADTEQGPCVTPEAVSQLIASLAALRLHGRQQTGDWGGEWDHRVLGVSERCVDVLRALEGHFVCGQGGHVQDLFRPSTHAESGFHREVVSALSHLGVPEQDLQIEVPFLQGAYSLDVVLTSFDPPLVIEAEGSSHFYRRARRFTATSRLKHRLLTEGPHGYTLLHIPHWEWRQIPQADGMSGHVAYLRRRIAETTGQRLDGSSVCRPESRVDPVNVPCAAGVVAAAG